MRFPLLFKFHFLLALQLLCCNSVCPFSSFPCPFRLWVLIFLGTAKRPNATNVNEGSNYSNPIRGKPSYLIAEFSLHQPEVLSQVMAFSFCYCSFVRIVTYWQEGPFSFSQSEVMPLQVNLLVQWSLTIRSKRKISSEFEKIHWRGIVNWALSLHNISQALQQWQEAITRERVPLH